MSSFGLTSEAKLGMATLDRFKPIVGLITEVSIRLFLTKFHVIFNNGSKFVTKLAL